MPQVYYRGTNSENLQSEKTSELKKKKKRHKGAVLKTIFHIIGSCQLYFTKSPSGFRLKCFFTVLRPLKWRLFFIGCNEPASGSDDL